MINNMKTKFIVGLCLMSCMTVKAQEPGSVFHFNVGAGNHDLSYDLLDGKKDLILPDYTINAAYSYFFTPNWGIQTGVGAQTFSGLSTLSTMTSTPRVDESGSFDFRTYYQDWQEKQFAVLVDIPLQFQYRTQLSDNFGLIAALGGRVSLPVYSIYKYGGNGSIETRGYFPQVNGELSNAPQHGFSTINTVPQGDITLKTLYSGAADLGALIKLSEKTDLYIGGYLNYGFNNCMTPGTVDVYQDGVYNGYLASNRVSEAKPISYGIKVGIYLSTRKKDTDGDGVPDRRDNCPKTPVEAYGYIDSHGCPLDSDGDGVPDYLDKCPNTPAEAFGMVDEYGCPLDSDGDGVADYLDKCPNTPEEAFGMIDSNGCPIDSDGDGVPDYLDKCPSTPKEAFGMIDANGCPLDSDGDGVPDYLDECPNTPKETNGRVDAKGCPLDTDGDGIYDYLDDCPNIPGVASNNGCPEIKSEVRTLFKKAMQGIQFETGKYVIRPVSFSILNEIAQVLLDNPTYLIEVQGHTDNVGSDEANLILSDKRAEAVKLYLISKGVDSKRLTSRGYGEYVPIDDNDTATGRALNRRVEFIVSFEKVEYK